MAEEDLIFGKNRHFFGGIEPSNMLEFKAEYNFITDPENVTITCKLPKNTVVDGQTLCTVAGAIIRRKKDVAPVNEFDGEAVVDMDSDGIFKDSIVGHDGETMVYAAFPYTTQGVYNRNPVNVVSIDLTYSEPIEPLSSFTYDQLVYSGGTFETDLKFTHPGNKYISGRLVSQLAGIMIRSKKDAYPINEKDGDLVVDYKNGLPKSTSGSVTGSHHLSGLEQKQKYYYAAFPYNVDGTYTVNESARVLIDVPVANPPSNPTYFKLTPAFILEQPVIVIDMDVPVMSEGDVSVPIVRKAGGIPQSKSDGDLVTTFYTSTPKCYNGAGNDTSGHCRFIDNVTGGYTYYYRAFPTSAAGVENTDSSNVKYTYVGTQWKFGYQMNLASSSPSNMTYTDDCASFSPASMGTSGQFNWGSWDLIPGTYFMPRPCILKSDGTVECYLNPHNYAQDEYGNSVNIDTSCVGDVMLEFPRAYVAFYNLDKSSMDTSASTANFILSNKRITDARTINSPFTSDSGGGGSDNYRYIYISAYPGTQVGNVIRSISGNVPKKYTSSDTYDSIIKQVALNPTTSNADNNRCAMFQIENIYIANLLVLITKTQNGQDAIGYGTLSSNTDPTGTTNDKGLFYCGDKTNTSHHVKVFGIEDFWGGIPVLAAGAFLTYNSKTDNSDMKMYGYFDWVMNVGSSSTFSESFFSNSTYAYNFSRCFHHVLGQLSNGGQFPFNANQTSTIGNYFGSLKNLPFSQGINGWHYRLWTSMLYYGMNTAFNGCGTGSATTYSTDYIQASNYPSTSLTSNFTDSNYGTFGNTAIPVIVGGGETSQANQTRRGPFWRSYQTNMNGVGTRVSYAKQ